MNILYGIRSCSTVKKARLWLTENHIEYSFHDFRKNGLDQALLNNFTDALGWEALLNKNGTTWRKLPHADRSDLDERKASHLMLEYPSIIKRPLLVLDSSESFYLRFSHETYKNIFAVEE